MVDLAERISALLEQECFSYKTEDYLDPDYQKSLIDAAQRHDCMQKIGSPSIAICGSEQSNGSTSSSGINEVWREKICEWAYQVIDHYDFSREVVSISLSYLDRYLSLRPVNKKQFQLLAMTCLYLAIKINELGIISMEAIIELSRGYFLKEHMLEMEMAVLRTLSWKVHPPTGYCFAKHFLFLLPHNLVNLETRHDLLELTRFITELSVIDYFFVGRRASSVAIAALMNAMEKLPNLHEVAAHELLRKLQRFSMIDVAGYEVAECRERLAVLYNQGGYDQSSLETPSAATETRTETISPVSVAYDVYRGKGGDACRAP